MPGKENNDNQSTPIKEEERPNTPEETTPFKQWQDPDRVNMGNDIESEIKIANSKGKREGGVDKEWHTGEGNLSE